MISWQDLDLDQPINWAHPLNRGKVAHWLALPQRYGAPSWWDLTKGQRADLKGVTSGYSWNTRSNPGGSGSVRTDGSAVYVNTNFTTLPTYTSGTVVWWMNPQTAYSGSNDLKFLGMYDGTHQFAVEIYQGTWYVGWYPNTRLTLSASSSNYATNIWQMYAVAWTPSSTLLYRNGVLLGSVSTTNAMPSMTLPVFLGGINSSGSLEATTAVAAYFNDVSFYSRALSVAEIAALYQLSQVGYPDVLNYQANDVLTLLGGSTTTSFLIPRPFVYRPRFEPAYYE
jgi:hypothetical protein